MSLSLGKRILIASHDAGGAEVLSSWVRKHPEREFGYLLEGPALKVFARKLGEIPVLTREQAFERLLDYDFVLTGTSWASDLEKCVVRHARSLNIPVASFLDHWSAYRERFLLDGQVVLPDELWVGDVHAETLAKTLFPSHPVKFEPNPYFDEIVAEIKVMSASVESGDSVRVLYIAEPVSVVGATKYGTSGHYGYTEFEALQGYFDYLRQQAIKVEKIRIRRHPAEPPGKYEPIAEEFRNVFSVEIDSETSLAEDCAWADWVVGCDSMAMVVAVLAGKRVFSCIPPGGVELILPYPEINQLYH